MEVLETTPYLAGDGPRRAARIMVKAVLLDIDGTLINSVDFHVLAWQETLERYGCHASFQDIREQIGKGGDKLMAVFLSHAQIKRDGKKIERERGEIFKHDYLPKVKAFPKLHELFERLKSDRIKMALASSARDDELKTYKRIIGIEPYLDAEASSDDAANSKPDPDIFVAALQGLKGVAPSEAIAVGDTPYDAEAAGKAGIRTIGVLCGGFAPQKLREAGCVALYRDPAELLEKYDESPLVEK